MGLWKRWTAAPSDIFRLASVSVSASIYGINWAKMGVGVVGVGGG